MTAVSNAGPLIHLAKIGRLSLLKEIFNEIIIPRTVKVEVVDKGNKKGALSEAIEEAIKLWLEKFE